MADDPTTVVEQLSPGERDDLRRVLARIARSAPAIDQALDALDHLADSGNLAALDGLLEEFDDNFSAVTRPELMGMVANLMMLMGVLSEVRYEPFFDLAMRAPAAIDDAYPRFRRRTTPLGLRETVRMMRSPELAGALELLVAVVRAQHGDGDGSAPADARR